MRAKFNYPDLDILDSPLMSSIPFSSLSGLPGSAIAENIFNDPDSWEENDDPEADEDEDDDTLAWLVEEIEKFKANSADVYGAFDPAVDNKKILDAGGIPHYIRPLSSALTPPSSSKITYYYPSKINTSAAAGSTVDRPSPVVLHSSSITMSFLEWYGIYAESDQNLRSIRRQYRKSMNSKIATTRVPPPGHAMPPSPPEERSSSIPPPGLEPPPHLPRSRSPAPTSTQSPPYLRTRSPAGSRPNSNSSSRSSSNSRSRSPTSTLGMSRRDSDAPTTRRRLPSIPTEASPLPAVRSSPKLPSIELPVPASQQLRPPSSSRPVPLACSPAGPRTRAGSRVISQDLTTRGLSLQHRPPGLKL